MIHTEEPNNFIDLNLFKLLQKRASFLLSGAQISGRLVKGPLDRHSFSGSGCCFSRVIYE